MSAGLDHQDMSVSETCLFLLNRKSTEERAACTVKLLKDGARGDREMVSERFADKPNPLLSPESGPAWFCFSSSPETHLRA